MNKKSLVILISALSWFGLAEVAQAASASSSLPVSATVSNTCIISAVNFDFGTYDPLSASPQDNTGTVNITCTNGASVTVELNLGLNASGSQRRLTDTGTNYVNYGIYQDAARTVVWGTAADALSTTGTGVLQPFTAYGRIPASQNVPAGSYTDTLSATVNF